MKTTEFIALLTANASKTTKVRTYTGRWVTGVSQIPDEIVKKIGKIVQFLNHLVENRTICTENEGLLIYNFQSALIDCYYSLSAVIKQKDELNETDILLGKPIQFIIDGNTTQVTNCSHMMLATGLLAEDELKDDVIEKPIVYGTYKQFTATTSFAIFEKSVEEMDWKTFFKTNYYVDILHGFVLFDSILEARDYIANHPQKYDKYILELATPKEEFDSIKSQLHNYTVKVIDYFSEGVIVTCNPKALAKEQKSEDELKRLKEAHFYEYQQKY